MADSYLVFLPAIARCPVNFSVKTARPREGPISLQYKKGKKEEEGKNVSSARNQEVHFFLFKIFETLKVPPIGAIVKWIRPKLK